MSKLIQLVIILALLFFAWKWFKNNQAAPSRISSSRSAATGSACSPYADSAANAWSRGIGKFTGAPPYDMAAWDSFRGDVQTRIGEAESHCGCAADSCAKAREAMSGLRGMVDSVDGMIRNNSEPPSDIVQRQENVDNLIDQAKDLEREGK